MLAPPARSTLVLAATVAALALAACGSDDDGGGTGSGGSSVADAKAKLSKDCQQGKASDKPLCDCIADKLQSAGNDAEEILAIDKTVNGGGSPDAVTKAAAGC